MADAKPRSVEGRSHPACASIGLTLLVLIVVSTVFAIRNAFTSFAPAYLMETGWTPSDVGQLLGVLAPLAWVVAILVAVVATYFGARDHMGWFAFLMSPGGRASRRQYWMSCWLPLTLVALVSLLPVAAASYAAVTIFLGEEDARTLTLSLLIPHVITLDLLLLWPSLAALIKRLHDRGRSGWFLLIQLIPLVGQIWLFFEVGLLPGQSGDNRYGPDPLASATPID